MSQPYKFIEKLRKLRKVQAKGGVDVSEMVDLKSAIARSPNLRRARSYNQSMIIKGNDEALREQALFKLREAAKLRKNNNILEEAQALRDAKIRYRLLYDQDQYKYFAQPQPQPQPQWQTPESQIYLEILENAKNTGRQGRAIPWVDGFQNMESNNYQEGIPPFSFSLDNVMFVILVMIFVVGTMWYGKGKCRMGK